MLTATRTKVTNAWHWTETVLQSSQNESFVFSFRATLCDIDRNVDVMSFDEKRAFDDPPPCPPQHSRVARIEMRVEGLYDEQVKSYASLHLSSNGDLDLDTGLNVDNDLLDDLGGGSQAVVVFVSLCMFLLASSPRRGAPRGEGGCNVLDETLVDAHLVEIPGLGTLTARSLTGGDLEVLGGQTNGALDGEVLALGTLEELRADLLEGGDLAAGQGDPDLVSLLYDGRMC